MKTKTFLLFILAFLLLNCQSFAQGNRVMSIKDKPIIGKTITIDKIKVTKDTVISIKDSILKDSIVKAEAVKIDSAIKNNAMIEQIAEADTTGLSAKNDSIKRKLIELQATASEDSVYVIGQDGIVYVHVDSLQKPTGKKLTDWLPYIIMVAGIFLLMLFSVFTPLKKLFANNKNLIVQRFFAQTSTFIKKVKITAVTLASMCGSLLALQSQMSILPATWVAVIQTTAVVCVAIAGFAQFTSKNPAHSGDKVEPKPENN